MVSEQLGLNNHICEQRFFYFASWTLFGRGLIPRHNSVAPREFTAGLCVRAMYIYVSCGRTCAPSVAAVMCARRKTIILAGIALSCDLVVEAFIWRGCFAAAPPEAATLERNKEVVTIAGHHFVHLWGMRLRKIGLWPRRQEFKQGRFPVEKTASNENDPLAKSVSFFLDTEYQVRSHQCPKS